jgi:hypothetical protein
MDESLHDGDVIGTPKGYVCCYVQQLDIVLRQKFPGMLDPCGCGQVSKQLVIMDEKGTRKPQLQFMLFDRATEQFTSECLGVAELHDFLNVQDALLHV